MELQLSVEAVVVLRAIAAWARARELSGVARDSAMKLMAIVAMQDRPEIAGRGFVVSQTGVVKILDEENVVSDMTH